MGTVDVETIQQGEQIPEPALLVDARVLGLTATPPVIGVDGVAPPGGAGAATVG